MLYVTNFLNTKLKPTYFLYQFLRWSFTANDKYYSGTFARITLESSKIYQTDANWPSASVLNGYCQWYIFEPASNATSTHEGIPQTPAGRSLRATCFAHQFVEIVPSRFCSRSSAVTNFRLRLFNWFNWFTAQRGYSMNLVTLCGQFLSKFVETRAVKLKLSEKWFGEDLRCHRVGSFQNNVLQCTINLVLSSFPVNDQMILLLDDVKLKFEFWLEDLTKLNRGPRWS